MENFAKRNFTFRLLSDKSINAIHEAGIDILQNLGILVDHDRTKKMLMENGAGLNEKTGAILLPRKLVEDSLKKCPPQAVLADRKGNIRQLCKNGERVYVTSNAYTWIDEAGNVCQITGESFANYVRIIDKLENIFVMVGTNLSDIPVESRDVSGFRIMLENTTKHIRPCLYTPGGLDVILKLADVVLDGRDYSQFPFFSFGYSIVSPLRWSHEACEIFQRSAGRKIPLMLNAEPIAGGTSPVTLAGSIALANAEVLSGVVINQLIEPGRPLIHNIGIAHVLDMQSAIALTGSPENSLMAAAGAELAAYYDMPCASWTDSDSFIVDSQAILEKMHTLQTHAMGGVNMIWGIGNLEGTLCYSPLLAVIDNEIIGIVERVMRGIEVNEQTIALDLIKEVGFSGSFLSTEHTYENFKSELHMSRLLNRVRRHTWLESGSKSLEDKCNERIREILAAEPELQITAEQRVKLLQIEQEWLNKLI